MITGFNTDVQHEGVTYHVQTEDKGLDSPLILSLVYVGGAIIASKRTPYEVGQGFDEKALTERLQRQHKLICAAIKAGRVEDLKRMGAPQNGGAQPPAAEPPPELTATAGRKPAGQRKKKPEAPPEPASPEAPSEHVLEVASRAEVVSPAEGEASPAVVELQPSRPAEAPPPLAEPLPAAAVAVTQEAAPAAPAEPEIVILTSLADDISAFQPPTAPFTPPVHAAAPASREGTPPAAAVRAAAPPPVFNPPPAAVKAEVIETPPELSNEIYLSLLDDEGEFRAGQLVTIKVYVGRGAYGQTPAPEAALTVKVLGTAFRPLIMNAMTDAQGVGVVRALLPRFTSGRAAIIIRAVLGEASAEMRRIIHQ